MKKSPRPGFILTDKCVCKEGREDEADDTIEGERERREDRKLR